MILMAMVWQALVGGGLEMVPLDARHVELRSGSRSVRLLLKIYPRPLKPSDVIAAVERHREPAVVVVPTATPAVQQAIERAGWSWLATGPAGVHGSLRFGDVVVRVGAVEAQHDRAVSGRSGPAPWGSLAVVRCLVEQPAATQKVLARMAQISQPRVSQVLAPLVDRQLVERTGAGWVVRDFDGLVRQWLDAYPGPGGIATYWYGLDTPTGQAQKVLQLLGQSRSPKPGVRTTTAGVGEPFAVVSGDVAADMVAPWRTPARAVIYARAGADLAEVGMSPVASEGSTLELVVPQDPGVWPHASVSMVGGSSPIADPLQILWDVQRSTGPDSAEAVARLWEVLRERSRISRVTDVQ
jgi:hypothetical protein